MGTNAPPLSANGFANETRRDGGDGPRHGRRSQSARQVSETRRDARDADASCVATWRSVERLAASGATFVTASTDFGEYCVTMLDPEGNEFDAQ
jgi:Glyoxalase-like domain